MLSPEIMCEHFWHFAATNAWVEGGGENDTEKVGVGKHNCGGPDFGALCNDRQADAFSTNRHYRASGSESFDPGQASTEQ